MDRLIASALDTELESRFATADVGADKLVSDVVLVPELVSSFLRPVPADGLGVYPMMISAEALLKVHIPFAAAVDPELRVPAAEFLDNASRTHHPAG